ncbi:hypothetical protein BBP40_000777 [Aspergillus hancockii]|nr:hypothetical protein BBP40_000777 [Aspergillus hancockii]
MAHSTRFITEPQHVADSNGSHLPLVPPMEVYVSSNTIHRDPEIWGSDVDDFRPSRWIDQVGQVITPVKGTFLPWSGGPQNLPGNEDVAGRVCRNTCDPFPLRAV